MPSEHFFVVSASLLLVLSTSRRLYLFINDKLEKKRESIQEELDKYEKLRKDADYKLTKSKLEKQEILEKMEKLSEDVKGGIEQEKKKAEEAIAREMESRIARASSVISEMHNAMMREFDKKIVSVAFNVVEECAQNDASRNQQKNRSRSSSASSDEIIH